MPNDKTVRVSVEFQGGITLEMPYKDITMSAEDATLLGFRLIQASIHATTDPINDYSITLH